MRKHYAEPGAAHVAACGRPVPEAAKTVVLREVACKACLKHVATMGGRA
jgi:hypothetical protein